MTAEMPRREFLERTALTAAGTMALAGVTYGQDDPTPQRVVVGVMGLSRGRSLAMQLAGLRGVEVKYVCDVDQNRATACAKQVGQVATNPPAAIGDFRHILDDAEVDALVCAAPNHWHGPATILACSAGKHVYVEKPCSHNPQEGEWMIAAAHKHNRAVQMGTQRRSEPGTQAAIAKLHDGTIGRVYLARAWYRNARPSVGVGKPANVPEYLDYGLWQGPAPPRPYLSNRVHYNWHWFWHWGNGELGNNGVHTLDLCRWGMGVDFPVQVTSSGGRYRYRDDQETPDTHTVCFQFEGDRQITWEGTSCNRHGSGFVTFYGEKGSLELDSDGRHRVYDPGDKLIDDVPGSSTGEVKHLENFVHAIRAGEPRTLNAHIETGHRSTLLCHLGNIAHRTGRILQCNPADGHILDDQQSQSLWRREYADPWEPKV